MSHVTRTPLSRSKGQRSTCRGGSILWRPPAQLVLKPQRHFVWWHFVRTPVSPSLWYTLPCTLYHVLLHSECYERHWHQQLLRTTAHSSSQVRRERDFSHDDPAACRSDAFPTSFERVTNAATFKWHLPAFLDSARLISDSVTNPLAILLLILLLLHHHHIYFSAEH